MSGAFFRESFLIYVEHVLVDVLKAKTKDLRPKTRKTKTLTFLREVITFQLPLPLSGLMN